MTIFAIIDCTIINPSEERPPGSEKPGCYYRGHHVAQMPSMDEGRNCLASDRQLSSDRKQPEPWGQGWTKTIIGLQPSMWGVRPHASPGQESENLGNKDSRGQWNRERSHHWARGPGSTCPLSFLSLLFFSPLSLSTSSFTFVVILPGPTVCC